MTLTQRDKSVIINILDEVLGVGTSLRGDEHTSSFILSSPQKEVTNKFEYTKWHCWVCDLKR